MSITASSSAALAAGLRPLTAAELTRLDWLRTQLRSSGADVDDAAALEALVDASRAGWARSGSATVPDGMVAALAVGLGDALVARAPGSSWVLRTVEGSSGPAVVDATGQAVVLPFEDLRARWVEGRAAWVTGYVRAAAVHLGGAPHVVPQPHPQPAGEAIDADPATSESASTAPPATPAPAAAVEALHAPGQPTAPWTGPTTVAGATRLPSRAGGSAGSPVPGAAPAPAPGLAPAPTPTPTAVPARRPTRPDDLPEPPSAAVQDLVLRALEHGLEAVVEGGQSLPLAVVPRAGRWHVERFPGGALDDARGWLAGSGAPCAALAWVGELDGDAAVLAEASDAGRAGLVVGHRFVRPDAPGPEAARRHAHDQAAEPVGDLVLLGQSAPVV
ncbi:hypothetical protein [Cellulomonas alba]|uniref:DUF3806 domain-containing protein n=1 Tax=Cellulomonas alba TaxID=3053467 RepID=A0ABT7SIA5_9CELL|nr:hypothetical protein [Cellulomonas alba]MDM7855302.1 hypothetical protein [Cellulomonas alba]